MNSSKAFWKLMSEKTDAETVASIVSVSSIKLSSIYQKEYESIFDQ